MHRLLLFSLLLALSESIYSQNSGANTEPDSTIVPYIQKTSLLVIPLVFYTPETKFGGGIASLYTFQFRDFAQARPSQVQLGFSYTQEKQILAYLPFQCFLGDNKYNIYGELGYYRYFYRYYGIGNATKTAQEERYDATFPRVRLNFMKRFGDYWYAGPKYAFDDYRITKREIGKELIEGKTAGSEGGIISSLGVITNFDNRDNLFFPKKGMFFEGEISTNSAWLGSPFSFSRLSLDYAFYQPFGKKSVLATNTFVVFNRGEVPFQQMAFIGGTKKMRGFFEGRFRDKNLLMQQAEFRFPIYKRLGAVAFGGIGKVSNTWNHWSQGNLHWTIGSGLRFQLAKNDPINIRLDIGFNEFKEFFPYLTVREAF